jgi:hypothetical protein
MNCNEMDIAGIGCEDTLEHMTVQDTDGCEDTSKDMTVQDTDDTFPVDNLHLDGITHEDTKVQDVSGEAAIYYCSNLTVFDTAANINLTGGIPMNGGASTALETSGGTVKIGSETMLINSALGALQSHVTDKLRDGGETIASAAKYLR